MSRWLDRGFAALVRIAAAFVIIIAVGQESHADEWTAEDFGPRRIWKTPRPDAEKLRRFMREERFNYGNLNLSDRRGLAKIVKSNTNMKDGTPMSDDDALKVVQSILFGSPTEDQGKKGDIDAATKALVRARASEQAVTRAIEDENKKTKWGVVGRFQKWRDAGFSLRQAARKRVGYKNPASLEYGRDLVTDKEKLDIDFGLSWHPKRRWVLARNANGAATLAARPLLFVDGDLTTQKAKENNHWGGGAALEFDLDCNGICPDPCCGTVRWKFATGVDWARSQKGKRERATAWVAAEPVVADIAMGFRIPLGSYKSAPMSFVWQPSARLDYGRNIKGRTRFEASKNFLRGSLSGAATLYFDALGRWARGTCENAGTLCKPGTDRKHDPYLQAEYESYFLDEGEFREWFQFSFVFPVPGDEGFSVIFSWEKGAQAPITFAHEETFAIKVGVRF